MQLTSHACLPRLIKSADQFQGLASTALSPRTCVCTNLFAHLGKQADPRLSRAFADDMPASSSPRGAAEPPPKPSSYTEILEMLEQGRTPPGIRVRGPGVWHTLGCRVRVRVPSSRCRCANTAVPRAARRPASKCVAVHQPVQRSALSKGWRPLDPATATRLWDCKPDNEHGMATIRLQCVSLKPSRAPHLSVIW